MTRERNAFFLVLVINQKLISFTILSLRKLLLVMMSFFMKIKSGHGMRIVLRNKFQLILMDKMMNKGSSQ